MSSTMEETLEMLNPSTDQNTERLLATAQLLVSKLKIGMITLGGFPYTAAFRNKSKGTNVTELIHEAVRQNVPLSRFIAVDAVGLLQAAHNFSTGANEDITLTFLDDMQNNYPDFNKDNITRLHFAFRPWTYADDDQDLRACQNYQRRNRVPTLGVDEPKDTQEAYRTLASKILRRMRQSPNYQFKAAREDYRALPKDLKCSS